MSDKDEIIKKTYYDRSGYGSIQKTYQDAKNRDNTITLENVRNWFYQNVENKRKPVGYNSFIVDEPYFEYQVDIAFFRSKHGAPCLVMIDTFSKYAVALPLPSRDKSDVIAGMLEGFNKMGRKPKMIYTDGEGALRSNLFEEFCNEEKIKLIITRTHAYVAERFIRTLKNAINRRLENDKTKKKIWKDFLFEVLLTYNNRDIHSAHGLTPNEARIDNNRMNVLANLELKKVSTRKYPNILIGDKVKLYRKKIITEKENKSYWLPTVYTVDKISVSFGQKYYHLERYKRPLLRHEILKVS